MFGLTRRSNIVWYELRILELEQKDTMKTERIAELHKLNSLYWTRNQELLRWKRLIEENELSG